ncbi:MAG: hypothetical protein EOM63_01870 [Clostridia bacterium]|nr:hypothetical protein [Clostridia bacterium]
MEYPVHTLETPVQLDDCPLFYIDHFQWNCVVHPQACRRMGYLSERGFLVRMECVETDPKREYTQPQSAVYRDSALEAFFAFTPCQPRDEDMYLNFEMNANGAMHAKYGRGRKNRQVLSDAFYRACQCHAAMAADRWQVEVLIPLTLICDLYDIASFTSGDAFYCNFYKISESPEIEHYASYHPLRSKTPNFHLPSDFARAVLV